MNKLVNGEDEQTMSDLYMMREEGRITNINDFVLNTTPCIKVQEVGAFVHGLSAACRCRWINICRWA